MFGRKAPDHPAYVAMQAEVKAWLPEVAPHADIEQAHEDEGWWIKLTPNRAGACPFTLGMARTGDYDLFVGELFSQEGWPWPDGVRPVALCRSIVAGKVVEREWVARWPRIGIKTLVTIELEPADQWYDVHHLLLPIPLRWCRQTERRFLPYF